MKPNIKLEDNMKINKKYPKYKIYEGYLSDKIKYICKKIEFSYDDIEWIIYDPKIEFDDDNIFNQINFKNINNVIKKIDIGIKGEDYGKCNISEKKIYISTLAIEKTYPSIEYIKSKECKNDFLAEVILDEITHICTKADHEKPKYDEKLKRFKKLYYN